MGTIRVFIISSIDGFYLPLDLQRFYGLGDSDYQNLYRDADIILTNSGRYAKLEHNELNRKKQMYRVTKDMSLLPYDKKKPHELTVIDQIKEVKKGNVLVIGNDNNLNSYLFSKNWVDEIIVCQFPVTLGKGRRSFPVFDDKRSWDIKGRQLFKEGVTMIFYGCDI